MKILVTGAAGFVGRNLVENLKNIRDGKNRTRPNLSIGAIYEYDRNNTLEELDQFCSDCDFVFNLAGVNRPQDPKEFKEGNFGFASTLLDTLKKHDNKCPVMLSSSLQATLAGRFGTSEYNELTEVVGHRGGQPHFLYGKVFCGECGAPMTRRTVNGPGGMKIKTWICREKRNGSGCKGRNVKEEELLAVSETATKIVVKEDGIAAE